LDLAAAISISFIFSSLWGFLRQGFASAVTGFLDSPNEENARKFESSDEVTQRAMAE
jgi:hypothetical protein